MGTMRHTRSSSVAKHDGYGPSTSLRGQTRQDHHLGVGRAGSVLDSPRVARRPGGPSMTGDRFLLLVSQLLGRCAVCATIKPPLTCQYKRSLEILFHSV